MVNLKKEAVHWRHFKTREEARQVIFAYIEGFYNTRRIQKRLDYLSPIQWPFFLQFNHHLFQFLKICDDNRHS
ncbi:MAG: IS3 family transposase [Thermacetogeniaceae bacterium]